MDNIYMQIAKNLELDINNGVYPVNRTLPSIRDLSRQYTCSQGTIIKAYEVLKNKHLIYSRPQSGYYIV